MGEKMRRVALLVAIAATLWLGLFAVAEADVVYQQPPFWTGEGAATGNAWVSHVDTTLTGFRAYDSFSLPSAATINQVSWWGFYLDGDLNGATANTTDWIVRFQADNAGAPGAVLKSVTIPSAQVNAQLVGTGLYTTRPQARSTGLLLSAAGPTSHPFLPGWKVPAAMADRSKHNQQ